MAAAAAEAKGAPAQDDTDPPQTEIARKPPARTDAAEASFTYRSSEREGRFECALDQGRFQPCKADGHRYRGLGPGRHVFAVRAIDKAGNADKSPARHAWTVEAATSADPPAQQTDERQDKPAGHAGDDPSAPAPEGKDDKSGAGEAKPPETRLEEKPAGRTAEATATFRYVSSESDATFECALDGAGFEPCPGDGQEYRDLSPGKHAFQVRAVDAAGNRDETPATHGWTITQAKPAEKRRGGDEQRPDADAPNPGPEDGPAEPRDGDATPPETTIEAKPPARTGAEAAFAYAASEKDATFQCRLDRGRFEPCEAGSHTYRNLRDGKHAFAVRAVDTAGNADKTPATHTWTVDTTGPQVARLAPRHRAKDVAVDADVAAVFSEAMDPSSLTTKTFTLVPEGGDAPVAATVKYDAADKRAVLDPEADLAAGTTYTATVTTAADAAGNKLAAAKAWRFTTAAPAKPALPGRLWGIGGGHGRDRRAGDGTRRTA